MMSKLSLASLLLSLCALPLSDVSEARNFGLATDRGTNSAIVFDADSNTFLGAVPINGALITDVIIDPNQARGYIADLFNIWVIDLAASPPRLAGGTNPIPISIPAFDLSLNQNGRFLLASSTGIVVVDTAAGAQISAFSIGSDTSAVDVCGNGSVLAQAFNDGLIRRLTLSPTGELTDTGEALTAISPANVLCSRNGITGAVITNLKQLSSFRTSGMQLVDTRTFTGIFAMSMAIPNAGNTLYARTTGGFVDAFGFDSTTGALAQSPRFAIPVLSGTDFLGIDQVAVTPDGARLYVPQPQSIAVYDAATGAQLASITAQAIVDPLAVAVADINLVSVKIDVDPNNKVNRINLKSNGPLDVAVLTDKTFNAANIDVKTVRLGPAGARELHQRAHLVDVDRDKDLDLLLHFDIQAMGLACGDTSVTLTGKTRSGQMIAGSDVVKTEGCP
ncbi:hypothetical protein NG726_26590 [Pseudomonas sp. MOB-449]|nr:hypothetical protein [Pseudomonas sp. MOB-449]